MDQDTDHLAIAPGNTWVLLETRFAIVEEPCEVVNPALPSILSLSIWRLIKKVRNLYENYVKRVCFL